MAETQAGAALTDAHRVAQVQLSGDAVAATRLLWSMLDPTDLPATKAEWMALQMTLMQVYDERAASLAATYLAEYRAAELGTRDGPVLGVGEFDAQRVAASMNATGPGKIAEKSGSPGYENAWKVTAEAATSAPGMAPALAAEVAFPILAGAVRRHVLNGGRRVIAASAEKDPRGRGWRRVSDGRPCAFCAMLVTRGPVYRNESIAAGMSKYHDNCGCTVELVYGAWRPTKQEQDWIDAYDSAAERADSAGDIRSQRSVLPRMRKSGLFNDSPTNATTIDLAPPVDLDAVAKASQTRSWLDAEAKYTSDVQSWLTAEQQFIRTAPARTITEREGRQLGRDTWFDYADAVDPDDAAMVRVYTGNSYGPVNDALRTGRLDRLSRTQREAIDGLDRVIDSAPRVPEKVTVSRAVGADVYGIDATTDLKSLVNTTYRDDAYLSTALQSKLLDLERNEVEVRLDVPAGTRGLYVSSHASGDPKALAVFGPDENELIIGRGLEYEFTDAFVEDGRRVLVGRVTAQDGGPRGQSQ